MTMRVNPLGVARILVILIMLVLMRSPALTNLLVFLLLLVVLGAPTVRERLVAAWTQPMVQGATLFLGIVAIGIVYSAGGWREGLLQLWGWRRLLFLPIGCALFYEPQWKDQFLRVFAVATALVATLVLALFLQASFSSDSGGPAPVTLVRNYVVQSMTFTVGLVACAVLAAKGGPRERWLWVACAVPLVLAITLASQGRSGYLVLLVVTFICVTGLLLEQGLSWRRSLLTSTAVATVGALMVWASPVARDRMDLAMTEARTYQSQPEDGTSIGLRIVFWKDALSLIAQKPVFGWGTGSYAAAQGTLIAGREGPLARPTIDPHNQYLKIAAENGLVGLAVFGLFLASFLRQRPSGVYRVAGLSVLAGWCVTSLANAHFSTFQEGHLLFFWLGIVLAHESSDPPPEGVASRPQPT